MTILHEAYSLIQSDLLLSIREGSHCRHRHASHHRSANQKTSFAKLSSPPATSSHLQPPPATSSHLQPPTAPYSHLSPPTANQFVTALDIYRCNIMFTSTHTHTHTYTGNLYKAVNPGCSVKFESIYNTGCNPNRGVWLIRLWRLTQCSCNFHQRSMQLTILLFNWIHLQVTHKTVALLLALHVRVGLEISTVCTVYSCGIYNHRLII